MGLTKTRIFYMSHSQWMLCNARYVLVIRNPCQVLLVICAEKRLIGGLSTQKAIFCGNAFICLNLCYILKLLTHWETRWPPFCRQRFEMHFLNENISIFIKHWLKSVPKVPIDNMPASVQIMVWRWIGDKPLSELVMAQFADVCMRHSVSMR